MHFEPRILPVNSLLKNGSQDACQGHGATNDTAAMGDRTQTKVQPGVVQAEEPDGMRYGEVNEP